VAFIINNIYSVFSREVVRSIEERGFFDCESLDSSPNSTSRMDFIENESNYSEALESEIRESPRELVDHQVDCQNALDNLLRREELKQDVSSLSERLGRMQSLTHLMSPVGGVEVGLYPEDLFHLPSSLSVLANNMLNYHKQMDPILQSEASVDICNNRELVYRQVRIEGYLGQLKVLVALLEVEGSPSSVSEICGKLHSLNLAISKEFRDQKVLLEEMRGVEELQNILNVGIQKEFISSFCILLEDSKHLSASIKKKISSQKICQDCLAVLLAKKSWGPRFAFLNRRLNGIKILTNLMISQGGIDASRYPKEYFNILDPANDSALRKCGKRMFGFYEKLAILKNSNVLSSEESDLNYGQFEDLARAQVKIEGLLSQLDSLMEVSEKNRGFLRLKKICEKMESIKTLLLREMNKQRSRLEHLKDKVDSNEEELKQCIEYFSTVLYLGKYRQEVCEDRALSRIFEFPLSPDDLDDSTLFSIGDHAKTLLKSRVEIEKSSEFLKKLSVNFGEQISKQVSRDCLDDFEKFMQRMLSTLSETSRVLQALNTSSIRKEHLVKSMRERIDQELVDAIELNDLAFSKLIGDNIYEVTNSGNWVLATKQLIEIVLAFPMATEVSKIQEKFIAFSEGKGPISDLFLKCLEFKRKPKEMGLCDLFSVKVSQVDHWTPEAIDKLVKSQIRIQKYLYDIETISKKLNKPENYADISLSCRDHKAAKKALLKEVDQVEIFKNLMEREPLNDNERAYFEYIKTYFDDLNKSLFKVKKIDYNKKRQTEIEKRYFLKSLSGKVEGINSNSTKFTLNSWKNFFNFQKQDTTTHQKVHFEAKVWFEKISAEFSQQAGKKYGCGAVGILGAGMYNRHYDWAHASILYEQGVNKKLKLSHIVMNIDKETKKKAGQDYVNDELKFQDLKKYQFYKVDCSKLVFAACTQVFLQKIYGNNWKNSVQKLYEDEQKEFHTACLGKFYDDKARRAAGRTVELNNSYSGWPNQTSYLGLGGQVGVFGYTNLVRGAEAVANTAVPGYNFGNRVSAAITNWRDRPRKIHNRMKKLIDLTNTENESMICSDFVLSSIIYSFEEMKVKLAKSMDAEIRSPNKTSSVDKKTRDAVKAFLDGSRDRIFELPVGVVLDPCKTLPHNLKSRRLKGLLKEQKGDLDIRKQLLNTVLEQNSLPRVGTTKSPSICSFNGKLYFTWRSAKKDQAIWFSSMNGLESISNQKKIPNDGTSESPSFTEYEGKLYYAMRTALKDKKIWYRSMDREENWSEPRSIPDVETNKSPALTEFNSKLYFFWGSAASDKGIWKRSLTGENNWSDQSSVINAKTDDAPSVATFNNRLYMAWKEVGTGQIRYTSMNKKESWTGKKTVPDAKSTTAPSLVSFEDKLYAFWKGSDGNKSIWFSLMDLSGNWTQPEELSCVSTQDKPTAAVYEGSLYLSWKGTDDKVWRTVIS
jgi:hypothetical protein